MKKVENEREIHLLEQIYRNAEIGRDGLYFVMRCTDAPEFRKAVETQFMEYQAVMDEAEILLRRRGKTPKGVGCFQRRMVRWTAAWRVARDSSPAALADMLIQGSSMGVTKILRQLHAHTDAAEEIRALADRLLETEENNICQMKQYL